MDFTFTGEQQMLRDSVSGFLTKNYDFDQRNAIVSSDPGWSRDIWNQLAELGLLMLPFSEQQGGLGGSVTELVSIAEPFGAHLLAEPYISSVLLAGAALGRASLGKAAQDSAAAGWLEKIIAGEAIGAFAYEEGRGTPDPSQIAMFADEGTGFTLTGTKNMVLGGGGADILIVATRMGEGGPLNLFCVDPSSSGVTMAEFATIDGRRAANVTFSSAKADLVLDDAGDVITAVLNTALLAICAESVGAMGALLKQTSDYAATRKQFGVAIGSFQVIAHRLADMKIAYSKARATLLYTTALIEAGQASPKDIAILKGQTGKLGREIGEAAIQTHGGVGMTDELAVGHFHKRILANDALFGSCEYHLRKVGALA